MSIRKLRSSHWQSGRLPIRSNSDLMSPLGSPTLSGEKASLSPLPFASFAPTDPPPIHASQTHIQSTQRNMWYSFVPQPLSDMDKWIDALQLPKEFFVNTDPLRKCFVVLYFIGDAPHGGSIHATINCIWMMDWKRRLMCSSSIKTQCCYVLGERVSGGR